ncbi:MAG: hypothetical protein ABR887_07180 [Methanoregulaceae archaeon]
MKRLFTFISILILLLLLTCSGCTNAPKSPPITSVPTTELPSTTTTLPSITATPVPLRTLPSGLDVDLQLSKDRTNSDITLHYNGGRGLLFVQKIMMRVTRSDGTVEEQYLNGGKKPNQGDEIVVTGTRGSDWCEVYVTTNGTTYKVIDEHLIVGGFYNGG